MWFIIAIVLIGVGASFGGDYLKHKRKMEQMRLDAIDKEIELERIRQENYLLENEGMRAELERIRDENQRLLDRKKDDRWLIEETKKEN